MLSFHQAPGAGVRRLGLRAIRRGARSRLPDDDEALIAAWNLARHFQNAMASSHSGKRDRAPELMRGAKGADAAARRLREQTKRADAAARRLREQTIGLFLKTDWY